MLGPFSLARALVNVRDRVLEGPLADLRRMPRTAVDTGPEPAGDPDEPGAWVVGRSHGLARAGSVSTYRYAVHPSARLRGAPVLLVSPLGACGVAFDLRRGCSLVEHLVGEGRHVHQVDDEDVVGHGPDVGATPADLARWVDDILPHVIRTVSAAHDGAAVHVVGWSIGGLLSVLTAAAHPDLPVASVAAFATPFALGLVPPIAPSRPLALSAGGSLLATTQTLLGLLPAPPLLDRVGLGHLDELVTAPLTVLSRLGDRDFLAQLEAVDDLRAVIGPRQRLVGTYLRDMIDPGDLAAGRVTVGARTVRLADLTRPVLLVAGADDVVAPPRSVRAGTMLLTGAPTSLTTAPGGHLGVLCGRAARDGTWPRLCAFLDRHDPPTPVTATRPGRRGTSVTGRRRRALPPAAAPTTAGPPSVDPDTVDPDTTATPSADAPTPGPAAARPAPDPSPEPFGTAPTDRPRTGTGRGPSGARTGRPAPKRATRTRRPQ